MVFFNFLYIQIFFFFKFNFFIFFSDFQKSDKNKKLNLKKIF